MEKKDSNDFDTAISYAKLALHTLQNSGTEITPKNLGSEMETLYEKFGTNEVKRLISIIMKEKKKSTKEDK